VFDCEILQIIEQGLMSKEDYEEVKSRALELFKFGQVQHESFISGGSFSQLYSALLNTKLCYRSFFPAGGGSKAWVAIG